MKRNESRWMSAFSRHQCGIVESPPSTYEHTINNLGKDALDVGLGCQGPFVRHKLKELTS